MKCYWTVNSSYWPPLRVSQYEVNTSWPPQQKSIVLQYWKPKINSFSYAEKKIMAYVHQLLDQPSQWQTSQQAGPCSVPKFSNTSITVKHLLIKNKNINQSKSSLLIWHYVSYLFLFIKCLLVNKRTLRSTKLKRNICKTFYRLKHLKNFERILKKKKKKKKFGALRHLFSLFTTSWRIRIAKRRCIKWKYYFALVLYQSTKFKKEFSEN